MLVSGIPSGRRHVGMYAGFAGYVEVGEYPFSGEYSVRVALDLTAVGYCDLLAYPLICYARPDVTCLVSAENVNAVAPVIGVVDLTYRNTFPIIED
jgi:hypothetical protein